MNKNILVVEDEVFILDTLALVLESQGYCVLKAANYAEAFQHLNQSTIDMVFSDLRLPDESGLALLNKIKQTKAWQNIPFVLVTAFYEDLEQEAAQSASIDEIIVKPFSSAQIRQCAHKYLLQNAYSK